MILEFVFRLLRGGRAYFLKDLKKNSTSDIANIASETSAEIIKQITTADVNKSNVSAVVNDVIKKEMGKHI